MLAAIGRVPNIKDLGLEKIGVELERVAVKVDDHHCTNVPGIYAIGDAINRP